MNLPEIGQLNGSTKGWQNGGNQGMEMRLIAETVSLTTEVTYSEY